MWQIIQSKLGEIEVIIHTFENWNINYEIDLPDFLDYNNKI